MMEWPKVHGEQNKLDADNPDHMKWMYEAALKRAEQFNIKGVTYRLTQGVVKNIIPAIASTNAVIAAAVCNEAFKIATDVANSLNNWMMYNGVTGTYTHTFEYAKKDNCPVCGKTEFHFTVESNLTLEKFIEMLIEDARLRLHKPSLRMPGKSLYMQFPPSLEASTRSNLTKQLSELITNGQSLDITDPVLPNIVLSVIVNFLS